MFRMKKFQGADSVGTQLLIMITLFSLHANALDLLVTFILSALKDGWMLKNRSKTATASNLTTGNPSSVRFARRPILSF
jgi:hypothetical protein